MLREQMHAWRFYDHLRTDSTAPARGAHVEHAPRCSPPTAGTRRRRCRQSGRPVTSTPWTGRWTTLSPGPRRGHRHRRTVRTRPAPARLLRPLTAPELSDRTLRLLRWVATLLTPVPPTMLALNEPETTLHPQLLLA